MITRESLPSDYVPFNELRLCSNILVGGTIPMSVGSELPLLIGKGTKPRIWLQALVAPERFLLLVEDSVSQHPAVVVYDQDGTLHVVAGSDPVLNVRAEGADRAVVAFLDLRPFGINVHGDETSLSVGSGQFSGNTMQGVGVFLGLGSSH